MEPVFYFSAPSILLLRFLNGWTRLASSSTHFFRRCVLRPPLYCFEVPPRDFEAVEKIKINPAE
jgi:hypothetical protein